MSEVIPLSICPKEKKARAHVEFAGRLGIVIIERKQCLDGLKQSPIQRKRSAWWYLVCKSAEGPVSFKILKLKLMRSLVVRKQRFTSAVNQNCLTVPKGLRSSRYGGSSFSLTEVQIAKFLVVEEFTEQCSTVRKKAVVSLREKERCDTLQSWCLRREILFLVNFAATVSSAFYSDLMNGRALFYNSGNFLLSQKEYLKVLPEQFAGLKKKSFLDESIKCLLTCLACVTNSREVWKKIPEAKIYSIY